MRWRIFDWDRPIPDFVSDQDKRMFLLGRYLSPVSGFIHFLFIFVFILVDAPVLAAYNALSVLIWTGAYLLNSRGHHFAANLVGASELFGFCTLAVLSFGPGAGFQFYLFCAMMMPFLYPKTYSAVFKVCMVAFVMALFVALVMVGSVEGLRVELSPGVQRAFLVSNIVGEGLILAVAGHFFSSAVSVVEAERDLEHQKARRLLYNVLPRSIADTLTDEWKTIADKYDHVSVLFCDLVGFTKLSDRTSPEALVEMLNVVFSRFDDIAERYGLEKIKTIGDAYMVVAGLPDPRPDHAEALAEFALDITDEIQRINKELGSALDIRVGIHSGSAVAGIIGKRRFAFDLWGDSVNTASRMESHSEPGRIQITEQTRELLQERFVTERRGTITVKGKGEMTTHFLVSRR